MKIQLTHTKGTKMKKVLFIVAILTAFVFAQSQEAKPVPPQAAKTEAKPEKKVKKASKKGKKAPKKEEPKEEKK